MSFRPCSRHWPQALYPSPYLYLRTSDAHRMTIDSYIQDDNSTPIFFITMQDSSNKRIGLGSPTSTHAVHREHVQRLVNTPPVREEQRAWEVTSVNSEGDAEETPAKEMETPFARDRMES
ncbi:hypothetical protein JAAARDRAFT_332355 [Jaapia argillacea MUCL 33604]|uniref:Uncharacterized protein n=1 Tax=Jaapia argillacea MUCL 33604 TaxID=933084 RepID=A0A067PX68_9AGAM|nr:hypothetical protein JAAARDRAFT_332355 [Jaapia argillacea MUCL 33604]